MCFLIVSKIQPQKFEKRYKCFKELELHWNGRILEVVSPYYPATWYRSNNGIYMEHTARFGLMHNVNATYRKAHNTISEGLHALYEAIPMSDDWAYKVIMSLSKGGSARAVFEMEVPPQTPIYISSGEIVATRMRFTGDVYYSGKLYGLTIEDILSHLRGEKLLHFK